MVPVQCVAKSFFERPSRLVVHGNGSQHRDTRKVESATNNATYSLEELRGLEWIQLYTVNNTVIVLV
jgi:hypothetical protein